MSDYYSRHSRPEEKKKKSVIGRIFRFIGTLVLILVLAVAAMIGYLSATEYKPAGSEAVAVEGDAGEKISEGDSFTIMTWNTGYGALGDNADFFMDGGTGVETADEERVLSNMDSIIGEIKAQDPDVVFLQETDQDSKRSQHINELGMLRESLTGYDSTFANNFKVAFLPYPVPPIGKVDSGIATFSKYAIGSAERIQLPIPFSWPIRMANLKRCLLVSRVALEGTDKELVLVNLHLEAYDDGEGKKAQSEMLEQILQEEAEKGNYVIAGGDFNQIFSSADNGTYPVRDGMWAPGRIETDEFDGVWHFVMDERVPSCRSLDRPLEGADLSDFQFYLIDGFIVSGNVTIESAATLDKGFKATDHNPVFMELTLGDAKTDI